MFTNERLFTIQAFTITRVHCTKKFGKVINTQYFHRKTGLKRGGKSASYLIKFTASSTSMSKSFMLVIR